MRLLLIDGHYYLYRSFFAIRGLRNSAGEPTNAIYGFVKAVRKMIADVKPDHGAVVWDAGLPARRIELQPAYKQQRPPMPDDLKLQEDPMQELCPSLGLASVSLPNVEADDLIASYAEAAVAQGGEVFIATADKDILQIVRPGIAIYSTSKQDVAGSEGYALLGRPEVEKKWGVDPAHIADVLALTGDSSDNIAGVPGVGLKTASALVREHGGVETLLADLGKVSNVKLREKLAAAVELIRQNRQMVELDRDLPLPVDLAELGIKPNYPALIDRLRRCEFKSLLAEVEREAGNVAPLPAAPRQGELF